MKKKILALLSKKALSLEEVKKKVGEDVGPIMEEMEKEGLIFLNSEQQYIITFLGKIMALGLEETYKKIVERKDLFDFFKTRIPSVIPDKLIKSIQIYNDFQIIGKPDLMKRNREITSKALSMQLYTSKALYVSAPIMFKPGMFHMLGLLKERTQVHVIVPESEYKKHAIFYAVSKKVAQFKVRAIRESDQYMGLLIIDNRFCLFGFRTIENKPGWDAVIYTETRECIEWVKENFDYMWKNLAFSEE